MTPATCTESLFVPETLCRIFYRSIFNHGDVQVQCMYDWRNLVIYTCTPYVVLLISYFIPNFEFHNLVCSKKK